MTWVTNSGHKDKIILIVLTLATGLVGLSILLLNARNYFPSTYYIVIFVLIVSIFIIIIHDLFGDTIIGKFKYIYERRRHNSLSRRLFKKFKDERFLDDIIRILPGRNADIKKFDSIIDELNRYIGDDKNYHEIVPFTNRKKLIVDIFGYWCQWYVYYKRESRKMDIGIFSHFFGQLSYIINNHIDILLECIQNGKISEKINNNVMNDMKNVMDHYKYFRNRYNSFIEESNRELSIELDGIKFFDFE